PPGPRRGCGGKPRPAFLGGSGCLDDEKNQSPASEGVDNRKRVLVLGTRKNSDARLPRADPNARTLPTSCRLDPRLQNLKISEPNRSRSAPPRSLALGQAHEASRVHNAARRRDSSIDRPAARP